MSGDEARSLVQNMIGYRFDPKLDFVFKALFTQKTEESRLSLMDFLSCVLNLEIVDVLMLENELAGTNVKEKNSTFDIHAKINGGAEINVEIQFKEKDNIKKRAEFLCCRLYGTQEAKGKLYNDLNAVYEIMIVNFTLFENDTYLDEYMYRNSQGDILTGNTRIIFIELPKIENSLKKSIDDLSGIDMWTLFLRFGNDERHKNLINTIEAKRKGIHMAGEILNTISNDRAMQLACIDRYMYETDQISQLLWAEDKGMKKGMEKGMQEGMQKGMQKGMEQGMERGEQQKAIAIAQKMKLRGTPVEFIVEDTGLTIAEIEAL